MKGKQICFRREELKLKIIYFFGSTLKKLIEKNVHKIRRLSNLIGLSRIKHGIIFIENIKVQ